MNVHEFTDDDFAKLLERVRQPHQFAESAAEQAHAPGTAQAPAGEETTLEPALPDARAFLFFIRSSKDSEVLRLATLGQSLVSSPSRSSTSENEVPLVMPDVVARRWLHGIVSDVRRSGLRLEASVPEKSPEDRAAAAFLTWLSEMSTRSLMERVRIREYLAHFTEADIRWWQKALGDILGALVANAIAADARNESTETVLDEASVTLLASKMAMSIEDGEPSQPEMRPWTESLLQARIRHHLAAAWMADFAVDATDRILEYGGMHRARGAARRKGYLRRIPFSPYQ